MQTPIEQILSSFDGLELVHFVPVLLVSALILATCGFKRRRSRRCNWVKGKGFVNSSDAILERAKESDDPRMEDLIEKIRKDIAEKS